MPIPAQPAPRPPELVAPAGDWTALRAAVANGADAVYFGLRDFNARLRAANFAAEELPEVIAYLHGHNVRGYVTLNTLVFPDELDRAAECLAAIAQAGADAVVVQDLGIVRLARRLAPGLPVHASTQMTLTDPRGIAIARELGIRRVILARELSLKQIGLILRSCSSYGEGEEWRDGWVDEGQRRSGAVSSIHPSIHPVLPVSTDGACRWPSRPPIEVEVFVHGALCVSYSGQCLASLAMGGRSGNRGQCAQCCRLPYTLIADGKPLDQGDRRYLLSPKDLAAYGRIEALVGLGVAGFKIEGRLKSAAYVAAATRVYRAALDAALARQPFTLSPDQEAELAQGFSRGFTRGFLDGVDHKELVSGRSPKSRGLHVGTVVGKSHGAVVVELSLPEVSHPSLPKVSHLREGIPRDRPASESARYPPEGVKPSGGSGMKPSGGMALKPGDGVVFETGRGGEDDEPGGRVMAVRPVAGQPGRVEIAFRRGDVRLSAIALGSVVWKTDDPAVQRRLEQSYARDRVGRPVPLAARVWAELGQPLRIELRDDAGHAATVPSENPLVRAEKHPLTLDLLREQLGRLGGTPFELGSVEAEKLDPVMAPKSVLNDLRRQAVEALLKLRAEAARHLVAEPDALARLREEFQTWTNLPPGAVGHVCSAGFSPSPPPSPPAGRAGVGAALFPPLNPSVDGGGQERPEGRTTNAPPLAAGVFPLLHVLVRDLGQLGAVLDWSPPDPALRPTVVYCDFADTRLYGEAMARCRAAGVAAGLATLRIAQPGEEGSLEEILGASPDMVLVRNLAGISFFRERAPALPLVGDFSLNVANDLAASVAAELGLARVVPSADLATPQTAAMAARLGPAFFEAVLHQHVPMFHTEHCLFAASLSPAPARREGPPSRRESRKLLLAFGDRGAAQGVGSGSFQDLRAEGGPSARARRECGRPCRRRVELRDRTGAEHPVACDAACRNTVFCAAAQSAAGAVGEMKRLGICHFRIDLLRESPEETRSLLGCYARLLAGLDDARTAWRRLRDLCPGGLTAGTSRTPS